MVKFRRSKNPSNLANINRAIKEYDNSFSSAMEICQKYGITYDSFAYHYYKKPKKKLLVKKDIVSENLSVISEKRIPQNVTSESNYKIVSEPSAQRRTSINRKHPGHEMYKCTKPIDQPKQKKIAPYNPNEYPQIDPRPE